MPTSFFHAGLDRLHRCFLAGFLVFVSSILASAAVACPNVSMTGQQISWSSDQLWQPRSHQVTAGGSDNLANCSQPGTGWVATSPDFDFNFTDNSAGRTLELRADGSCDVVLLVNDAHGRWHFDDDSGNGTNASISIPNAPTGIYDIWVGTYGSSLCPATLTLETFGTPPGASVPPVQPPSQGAICPDYTMNGQILTYSAQGLWTPQRFGVTAGGNVDLSSCPTVPGTGHVIQSADFTLNLTDNSPNYDLEFRTEGSGCDTVLLVNDATGQWHFNDDDGGLTSRLRLSRAQPGQYDIWVGTFGSSTCQTTLVLETFGGQVTPPPPTPATCPSYANSGQMLSYTGQQLWTPQRHGVVAGGNVNLGDCQAVPGHGWVIESPDFTLNLTDNSQNYDLEFRTEGQGCDTVLLVNDATGQWHFNDDDGGLTSRLRLSRAQPGRYDIWVGTFGQQTCQTTLVAETFGGQAAAPDAQGVWQLNANGWNGTLVLTAAGGAWQGTITWSATGGTETLSDIRFDPGTRAISFTRPIPAAQQVFQGFVNGNQISGRFSVMGGSTSFNWSASR